MLTLKNLLDLEEFNNFEIIAGAKGIHKQIASGNILDFEFTSNLNEDDILFDPNSVVLSSLLFAKDDPSLLTKAVKKLITSDVTCLAFKNVFYDSLPTEVIDIANRCDFPIVKFAHKDAYFEDIIFAIISRIKKETKAEIIESYLNNIINNEKSKEEVSKLTKSIKPGLNGPLQVAIIELNSLRDAQNFSMKAYPEDRLEDKCIWGNYDKDFILIMTQATSAKQFRAMLESICISCSLSIDSHHIGISNIHTGIEDIRDAIIQAKNAKLVAKIEKENIKYFDAIGDWSLIIEIANTKYAKKYLNDFMHDLLELNNSENEIIDTAINYILHKGDISKVAETMYCHKNTIRYRIKKISEITKSSESQMELYENISLPVKLYLIKQNA